MALQTRNLWMLSLAVEADTPPDALQPPLPDGIHLRWAFDPARGFPWYGYYLFRRPAAEAERVCLSPRLRDHQTGPLGSTSLSVGGFTVTSDAPLVLTDTFPPPSTAELSLHDRRRIRVALPAGSWAWRAEVTIGFDETDDRPQEGCAELERLDGGDLPNPLIVEGVRLQAFDDVAQPLPSGVLGDPPGWAVQQSTRIDLPRPSVEVEVWVTGADPRDVVGYDADGAEVARASIAGAETRVVVVHGLGIKTVVVSSLGGRASLQRVCWRTDEKERDIVSIPVRGLYAGAPSVLGLAQGRRGDVVTVVLASAAIDTVEVGGGPGALIDVCVRMVSENLGGPASGWRPVAGAGAQPIALPVANTGYPCPSRPPDAGAAEALALGRITYGTPANWAGGPFADVHAQLEALVVGGPAGPAMVDRGTTVPGSPRSAGVASTFTHRRQRPLDLVSIGALNPALAQQLGLYALDRDVLPGQAYDYLLLADFDGSLGGSVGSALAWLAFPDFTTVDGFLAAHVVMTAEAPPDVPTGLRSFALPGGTVPLAGGGDLDATCNAGLTWDRRAMGTALEPGAPVLYHVWRAGLGDTEDPPSPPDGAYAPVTAGRPIPVTRPVPTSGVAPQPGDWPPQPLHFLDRGLEEGWYAYRISGVDLFGRHSAPSAPAGWWQWGPEPSPRPWYYTDPAVDALIDPTRLRLLDKLAPPPPTGVEAFALDPADPTVLTDAAWATWQVSLSPAERADNELIGLRVRWRWPVIAQRQAPDTREFRVYYATAPVNSLVGRVSTVTAASATRSAVTTDITGAFSPDEFVELWLRVGTDSFRIVGNAAASPLSLTVDNIGPSDEHPPPERTGCTLILPLGHPASVDLTSATAWTNRRLTVGYGEHVRVEVGGDRTYELFLPGAGSPDRHGLPLATTPADPIAYGLVGISAADARPHTSDTRGDPARWGNESRVSPPATVFRVRRVPPPAPTSPPDSEKVFTSAADYAGHSFYTARWLPAPHLRTHVYRALDDAVVTTDARHRPRPALDGTEADTFPPEWTALKRATVAIELNRLNGADLSSSSRIRATYAGLSNDGLRVLAGLPGNEKAFTQITPRPLDPDEPDRNAPDGLAWRRVGRDVPAGSLAAGERAYVDTLDGRTRSRWLYRSAYVDAVQNRGPLSQSSPPVWLPVVVPPRAPVPHSVVGGEQAITLRWASNREPDLTAYRILRSEAPDADVRLMAVVGTVAVPAGDPALRPAAVSWTDDPVPGLVTLHYRLVALDTAGNVSPPSPSLAGRAHDTALPVAPPLTAAWTSVAGAPAAAVSWASTDQTRLERQTNDDVVWTPVGDWRPPGAHAETHPQPDTVSWRLRLRARRYTGAMVVGAAVTLAHS